MTAATEIQRFQPTGRQVSASTTVEQSRAVAEVQAQVVVAQNCPRDINRAIHEMRESCGRTSMAEKAFYAVPNRGEGVSVHLMRECARAWGNIQHGSHELHRDDTAGVSEVLAFSWDVQTNTRASRTFITPHERMKGGNRQHLTDLTDIQNNNNSVAARAVRECIGHVLPRWFVEEAAAICRQTLEHGEGVPLPERINLMVDWFGKAFGVTVEQIEARLEKKRGQWDAADVAAMKIAGQSIKAGEATKAELFPAVACSSVDEIAAAPVEKAAAAIGESLDRLVDIGVTPEPREPADEKPKRNRRTKAEIAADRGKLESDHAAARQELEAEIVTAAVAADQAEGNYTTTPPQSDIVITSVEGTTGEDVPLTDVPEQPSATTPESQPGPITGRQIGRLFSLRANIERCQVGTIEGDNAWKTLLSSTVDRPVTQARDLNDEEAAFVIDVLEAGQQ
jgi:hypothetical protein